MAYLDDMRSWAQRLPYRGGKWEDHEKTNWLISSPFREDRNPSFSIDLVKRTCLDRASGEKMLLSEFCQALRIEEPSREDGKILPSRGQEEAAQPEKDRAYIQDVWNRAAPAPADFPYLQRKQVPPHSCRTCYDRNMADHVLLVPAYNASGELVGLERIPATQGQDKKHLKQKKEAYHLIGTVSEGKPVYVAEGYATAASLHLITGQPVAVAFTAWNLEPICQIFKTRYKAEPYACPDAGDAGKTSAAQCRSAGFRVVELPPDSRKGLDWNDVHVEQGLEPAKSLFREARSKAQAEKTMVREEKNSSSFILRRIGDLQLMEPEFLVDDLFEADALCLFFGESGCKKSFVALDMAASIATGAPFYGKQTKEGAVIYLAGEGNAGMTRRAEAWSRHRGISLKEAPLFLSSRAALLMDEHSARLVEEEVDRIVQEVGNPLLIIIDTVARSIVGGDENSAKDVSVFVERVDALRRKYGASALLVHHSGIIDKGRLRGSSAWKGALDAEFLIESSGPDGRLVSVECKKMKDAPIPAPFSFEAVEYVVMETRTGKAITSLALEPTDEKPAKVEKMSRAQKTALDTYHAAAKEKPIIDQEGNFLGVHVEDWRDYFYSASTADSAEGKKKAYQRARNDLVSLNVLTVKDDLYSPVRSEDSILTTDYAKKIRAISNQDTGTSGQNENVPVCLAATEPQKEGRLFAEGTEKSSGQPGQSGTLSRNVPAANYTKRDNRDIILRDVPCPGSLSRSEGEEKNSSAPRGYSVSELATLGGVSVEAVQEELGRWETCGRLKEEGGRIIPLEGSRYPGDDQEPSEEEDEPPVSAPKGPPKLPAAPPERRHIGMKDVTLSDAEAWASVVPGLVQRLKAQAVKEHDPMMQRSARDLYESLVRIEYADQLQRCLDGEAPGQEGDVPSKGSAFPGEEGGQGNFLFLPEKPKAPAPPPGRNPFLELLEDDDDEG